MELSGDSGQVWQYELQVRVRLFVTVLMVNQFLNVLDTHCPEKYSESLHKNRACHGRSRFHGIYLVSLSDIRMRTYTAASSPALTGSGLFANIQIIFTRCTCSR